MLLATTNTLVNKRVVEMMLHGFVEAAYTLSWFYHMEKTPINATIKDAFRLPLTFSALLVDGIDNGSLY